MREHQEHHPWFSKPTRHKVQSPLEPITVRAALAQSVERFTRNEKVVGSIPTGGSTKTPAQSVRELGFCACFTTLGRGRIRAVRWASGRTRGEQIPNRKKPGFQ